MKANSRYQRCKGISYNSVMLGINGARTVESSSIHDRWCFRLKPESDPKDFEEGTASIVENAASHGVPCMQGNATAIEHFARPATNPCVRSPTNCWALLAMRGVNDPRRALAELDSQGTACRGKEAREGRPGSAAFSPSSKKAG